MIVATPEAKAKLRTVLRQVKSYPKLMASLRENLKRLRDYCCEDDDGAMDRSRVRCDLHTDFAPLSFSIAMYRKDRDGTYRYWFNGALIYHGSHDGFGSGDFPTLAVTLTPTHGWSLHT